MSFPKSKRTHFIEQDEIDMDVPDGSIELGKSLFRQMCAGCHNLYDSRSVGPSLNDVFNRRAGIKKDYPLYSQTLKSGTFHWTRKKLFEYLENPENMVPDTNMYFDGIQDGYLRASIIDYLQYLKLNK